jgi:histidine triad (HIT) family protein
MDTCQKGPEDCFICQKQRGVIAVPGGAIYEDSLVYAGHARLSEQGDVYLGYLMAETRRHVGEMADLTEEEACGLGWLTTRLSKALKDCCGAEHVYAFVLGDATAHLHIHLVPRYPGAPHQYWGVHVDEWPDAPHGGAEEVDGLCWRLRAYLSGEGSTSIRKVR